MITTTRLQPAVFLDLNGTMVLPVQASFPQEFMPIPGCTEAVALLNRAGFICPVVTVQSRIAKGIYSEADFHQWFAGFQSQLRDAGATLVGPYVCPHRSSDACACAKPQPRLYLDAAREHGIDIARSFVVGDTLADVQAAATIGATGCFVRTGWGPIPGAAEEAEAAFVGDDLFAVAQWIIRVG